MDYFVKQNHRNTEFQMMYIPDRGDTPSVLLLSNLGDRTRQAKSRVIPDLSFGPEQVLELGSRKSRSPGRWVLGFGKKWKDFLRFRKNYPSRAQNGSGVIFTITTYIYLDD